MHSILGKFALAAIVAAAPLATSAAMAEATMKVPFSFTVSGQTLPAGVYSVDLNLQHTFVTLKSRDSLSSVGFAVKPGDPSPLDTRIVLTFDQVAQNHALKSVQYGSMVTARLHKMDKNSESLPPTRIIEGQ